MIVRCRNDGPSVQLLRSISFSVAALSKLATLDNRPQLLSPQIQRFQTMWLARHRVRQGNLAGMELINTHLYQDSANR